MVVVIDVVVDVIVTARSAPLTPLRLAEFLHDVSSVQL